MQLFSLAFTFLGVCIMNRRVLVSPFVLLVLLPTWADAQASATAKDEQAIRQAVADMAAAFTKGDVDAGLAAWANDADYIDDTGKVHKGKAAIAALFKQALAENAGRKFKIEVASLRFLKPDVVMDDGTIKVTDPDGHVDHSRYTAVWMKVDGTWRLTCVRDLPTDNSEAEATSHHAHLKQLDWLLGEWQHTEKDTTITVNVKWVKNKNFLMLDLILTQAGKEMVDATLLVAWDARQEQLRGWIFDDKGGLGEGWIEREGNSWSMAVEGVLPDGRTASMTHVLKFVDDNVFVWETKDREVDGRPVADSAIRLTKSETKGK